MTLEHNITLWRVRETTVAVESNKFYTFLCVCVCVCVCVRARLVEGMRMRACVHPCVRVFVCTSAGVCLGLLKQYVTRRRHIVCVSSGSTIFFDIIS